MTCPAFLLEECPQLKLLSSGDVKRRQMYSSAHDLSYSTVRRHSDDVDGRGKAYWLKAAKSHILGGYQTLKARLSTPRDSDEYLCRRQVTVEYDCPGKKKSKSSEDISYAINLDNKDDEHNLSSCLAIHSLKEGKFTAEISLLDCPPNDDVIIRIKHYRLEIFMQKRSKKHKKGQQHTLSQAYRCGAVDIPIYVDPATLTFDLVDEYTLLMEGATKLCIPQQMSMSQENLNSTSSHRTASTPQKTRSNSSTTWYRDNQLVVKPPFFRQRSYTN